MIDNNAKAMPVSTVVDRFFPVFDAYAAAVNLTPYNPLFGRPLGEIVQIWKQKGDEAKRLGTCLHQQIEKYYLNQPLDEETEEFHFFLRFTRDHPMTPYRTEWRIFDEEHNLAGTIDFITKNGNQYDIYDWKRSGKVVDNLGNIKSVNFGKTGIGGLSDILDTAYNRYCLQQNLYGYILEKHYGIIISNIYLVILHPDYDRYHKVEMPRMNKQIEYILSAL
ncbi:MAG: hypothetical protein LBU37_08530 [Tannerellaceae bacterium]|jgi:hypothetical protein|nr:hypothetical protein [Tannerellaceae bacterium]